MMRAVFIKDFGGPEQLQVGQLETPIPKEGEVQIKIAYTAINPVDWKVRSGLLKERMPYHFPIILGWDASGTISAIGPGVTRLKVGDPVFAYCRKSFIQDGTYAEYICVAAENVAFKPENLSFAQAAAIPLAGLTAWQALFDVAQLKKGESVLIHAGAGGVGSLAIQFAKVAGAHVITTVSDSKIPYVKNLGADHVIDYQNQSVKDEINKIFPSGVDVVFDTVGGKTAEDSYAYLKQGGRLVSLLVKPDTALEEKFKVKAFYLFVSPNGKELQEISNLIQQGKVHSLQIQEIPLEEAADAQEKVRLGHMQGKIVLKI